MEALSCLCARARAACTQLMVGVFWPSMMTMRASYVPEELRSTIINCFRIPLNLFVCVILYNVSCAAGCCAASMCSTRAQLLLRLLAAWVCDRVRLAVSGCGDGVGWGLCVVWVFD